LSSRTGSPGKRVKAIFLLGLLGLGTLFLADQAFKTPGVPSPVFGVDPLTEIWSDPLTGLNLDGYNTRLATFCASSCAGLGTAALNLAANSTHTAIALSKSPVGDLSISNGKTLTLQFQWAAENNVIADKTWGIFLTTNDTITNVASYDPRQDNSVILVIDNFALPGGATYDSRIFFQRGETTTISSKETGVCGETGSCFLKTNQAFAVDTLTNQIADLNYTGATAAGTCNAVYHGGPSPGCSWLGKGGAAGTTSSTQVVPFLSFGTVANLYIGYYATYGISDTIHYTIQTGTVPKLPFIANFNIAPGGLGGPQIDTGGFFGPIIKALISIGVFILTSIAAFLGFVANAFITAMDAVGGFFGLGAIGTAIRDALTGTANFIVNVFSVTVGWAVTLASLFQNGIGFITNFFSGSNGFVAWLVSFFSTLPGIWAIIQDFWTAINTVVFSMNVILVTYYIMGMFQVYKDGWNGFKDWLGIGTTLTVSVVKAGYWLGKEMFQVILDVKRLLAQWL